MLGRESRGGHRGQAKPWGPGGGTLQDARCTRGEGFELCVRVCASMRVCVRVCGCVHTGMRVGVCVMCVRCARPVLYEAEHKTEHPRTWL